MNEKETIKKELEELSPLLASIRAREQDTPKAPDRYFDNLADQVLAKANTPAPQLSVAARGLRVRRIALGLAASLALLLACWWLFNSKNNEATATPSMAAVDQYIENNLDDFEEDLLLEYVSLPAETPAFLDDLEVEDLENLF